ncbi:MAG TPA: hypothetical protein VHQ20_02775 [Patescibacteria group bacterium]|jgi:hypothetical protein|nr:hypothetical protein [Patescibacteria group bacterium]
MRKAVYKGLYLFLCSLLGMILLIMLHRAIFILYELLLIIDFKTYSLGMSSSVIALIDFFTMLIAIFLGGWYGIVLGIDWYAMVYGPNAEHPAGLFHAFKPHHWRGPKKEKKSSAKTATMTMPVAETTVKVPVAEKVREWTFDELLKPRVESKTEPKKRASAKSAAKKTIRKTATKRTKIIAE